MTDRTGTTEPEAPQPLEEPADASLAAAEDAPGKPAEGDRSPWKPSAAQLYRYRTPEAVAEAAAKRFLDSARRAVEKTDRFFVVLAGGSTPRLLYRRLTEPPYDKDVPWKRTYFVFGDERCVAPDDETSNYRMARENLLDPLEIPEVQVLRMKGEQVPAEAAQRYALRLGDLFLLRKSRRFDLVLLGVGTDGHTASLFPGTEALEESERWVVANQVPQLDAWRLTLTYPALNSTQRVIFMATGEEKAQVIAEAFGGAEHPEIHPCERVTPFHARREVLVDHAAASRLGQEETPKEGEAGTDPRDAGEGPIEGETGQAGDDSGPGLD